MSEREPKFAFVARLETYGDLPKNPAPLVICEVTSKGRLVGKEWPRSYDLALDLVDRNKPNIHDTGRRHNRIDNPILLGLNAKSDAYEIIYDPFDLGGTVDPNSLLNFGRTTSS